VEQVPQHNSSRYTDIQRIDTGLAVVIIIVFDGLWSSHSGRNPNEFGASLGHQGSKPVALRTQDEQDGSIVAVWVADGHVLEVVQRWRVIVLGSTRGGWDRRRGTNDAKAVFPGLIEGSGQIGSAVNINDLESTRTRCANNGTGWCRVLRTHHDSYIVTVAIGFLSSQKVCRPQQGTCTERKK
jgi:hypothetical protein